MQIVKKNVKFPRKDELFKLFLAMKKNKSQFIQLI